MKKIILIPDSFKGTMSSSEICKIMAAEIARHYPKCQVVSIPVADGGEGSVECFLQAVGGSAVTVDVSGPFSEKIPATYGLIHGGEAAVIEMAAAAGLPLAEGRLDPRITTTYGVGQLIAHAVGQGVGKVIVGLGGSCTNDGGCGAMAALGVRFLNQSGQSFVPVGGTLCDIARVDLSGLNPALASVEITVMCDIDNPMYGPAGAAHIFAPQKGATPEVVQQLDSGLVHLARVIERDLGRAVHDVPGAGAAGALGAGMVAFLGARLQMGIESVLDTVCFDEQLHGAGMVITGEGKIDRQSLRGKVVIGVARRAKKAGVPVVAIVGDIADDIEEAYAQGVSSIISINRVAVDFTKAKARAKSDLALTTENLMRFCKQLGL